MPKGFCGAHGQRAHGVVLTVQAFFDSYHCKETVQLAVSPLESSGGMGWTFEHLVMQQALPRTDTLGCSNCGKSKTEGEKMTVAEDYFFVKSSVSWFLNAGWAHLKAGGDPSAMIHIEGIEYRHS